jgi:hypothetical protein
MAERRFVGLSLTVMVVALLAAACGSGPGPDSDTPSPPVSSAAAAPSKPSLLGPQGSYAPIEVELAGSLPRSAEFLGVSFTVEAAHVTNTHPYTLFGEPRPGELLFAVLDVTAENATTAATEYGFDGEAFALRTYSGQLLPIVEAPGVYAFRRLEPGEKKGDQLVFGAYTADVLDGSSLLIGRPPDSPAIVALTAPPRDPEYPTSVSAVTAAPVQAGAISWSIVDGLASLDRPPGVCCPETGARADDGELFVTLSLRGLVSGSKYGLATVSSDALRLVVDGTAVKPFGFEGQANVAEGTAHDFESTWLIAADAVEVALEVGAGTPDARTIPLAIGEQPSPVEPSPVEPSAPPASASTQPA